MKNTIELQMRALRPPRILKKNDAGNAELIDVWAIHHADRTSRQWAMAVKFGREVVAQANEVKTGTLFTVRGQLDQRRNPATGIYHTFIWADEIVDLVHSKKTQAELAASSAQALAETPELDLGEAGEEHPTPESQTSHA
jgi:hypothetical protein